MGPGEGRLHRTDAIPADDRADAGNELTLKRGLRAKANRYQVHFTDRIRPIVIGQACEFDYSGTQACKALKEEGYRVISLTATRPAMAISSRPGTTSSARSASTCSRLVETDDVSSSMPPLVGDAFTYSLSPSGVPDRVLLM